MRTITIPNQSSVAKAFLEFDDAGRMKPSTFYERVVDVMEELVKFTLLTRDVAPYLVDRYSERRESSGELSKRVTLKRPVSRRRWLGQEHVQSWTPVSRQKAGRMKGVGN